MGYEDDEKRILAHDGHLMPSILERWSYCPGQPWDPNRYRKEASVPTPKTVKLEKYLTQTIACMELVEGVSYTVRRNQSQITITRQADDPVELDRRAPLVHDRRDFQHIRRQPASDRRVGGGGRRVGNPNGKRKDD